MTRIWKTTAIFALIAMAAVLSVSAQSAPNPTRAKAMAANSGVPGFKFAPWIVEKVRKGQKLVIKVIHQDVMNEFSQVIGSGVKSAAKDLKVDAEFTGASGETNIADMVALMETLITRKVDGIALANVQGEAFNPIIKKALAAGIPVIEYGTGVPGSPRLGFVGQNLVQSGVAQGELLAKALGGKGSVVIFSCATSAEWSLQREKGVRQALANYPGIKVVNIVETGNEDQQVYATIENTLRANPDLSGVATLCSVSTPATGRVISRMGKVGKLTQIGHDLQVETLNNIKAGNTTASLSQNPHKQGYEATRILFDFIMKGTVPKDVDTGILPVDSKNIDEYLQKLKNGEPIG